MTHRYSLGAVLAFSLLALPAAHAATLPVANSSFESPTTPAGFPAFPVVEVWQKSAQPPGIPLPGGVTWDQLAGVFPNLPAGTPGHIPNVDGAQAAYMFSIPGVSLFQETSHTFQPGNRYNFTVGILGGGGIPEGSSFQIGLYYRNDANQPVPLSTAPVVYSPAAFPNANQLYDYTVESPEVQAGDAWAGKPIGLEMTATFGTGVGYWDVDNVRLVAVPEPGTWALMTLGIVGLASRSLLARRKN